MWRDDSRPSFDVHVDVSEELGDQVNVIFRLDAPPARERCPPRREHRSRRAAPTSSSRSLPTRAGRCAPPVSTRARRARPGEHGAPVGRPGPVSLLRHRDRPCDRGRRAARAGSGLMSKHHGRHKHHSFRVTWDGRTIAGVDRVSPLTRLVEIIIGRDGSSPTAASTPSPGRMTSAPVTLERPAGADRAFEDWAASASSDRHRKDVVVEILDRDGDPVLSFRFTAAGSPSTRRLSSSRASGRPRSSACGSRTTAGNASALYSAGCGLGSSRAEATVPA